MTLPEIQAEMYELAIYHDIPRLAELAYEMRRRRSKPRVKKHCETVTPELRAHIREYSNLFPRLSQFQIGQLFNVNQGRVSEALHGHRT